MVDLGLEREMRNVLMDLEMTSCGVTASLDASGGGEAFASAPPKSGDHNPPHVYYREQWNKADGDRRRRDLLDRAKCDLRAIRKAPPPRPEETEEKRIERLLKDGDGWTAEETALAFRMTPSAVRKIRLGHGRDPERGLDDPMKPMKDGTPEERRRRAKVLMGEHRLSLRNAALVMGVSHTQVRRDLMARGEAKAA